VSPDLVIFDCDGVLIDSEALSCGVLAEVLTVHGYAIDAHAAAARFAGLTDREVARRVAEESGLAMPEDFAERVSERVTEVSEGRLQAMPGAAAVLAALEQRRCVASNSLPRRLARALEIAGLSGYFPPGSLFSSAMVAHGKPAPDLHLHAAATMGARPSRCVVIEDSATGVAAARAAGMPVIGFVGAGHIVDPAAHGEGLRAAGAASVVRRFEEIPEALDAACS
jgi:HAD superfamily hydrolase (TIGR01509 family)